MNVERPTRTLRLPWRNRQQIKVSDNETMVSRRIPFLGVLPLSVKNNFIAMMGEFVGTFLFLFFAFGGTNAVNTAPVAGRSQNLAADPAKLLFICLCFGFSLAVNAWVFFRISGGLFNPAVSFGMMLVGAVPYIRGCLVIVSQILGAICAAAMIKALTPGGGVNIRTSLGPSVSVVQGLFIEMFCTALLVFVIFMLAVEKHKATFIAPIGIGLALFIAELFAVYYTGGSLNPARTFGPCVVARSFYSYHWIYWVGPALGSILAAGFYMFIKALEYETVNPEQDTDGTAFNPDTIILEKVAADHHHHANANANANAAATYNNNHQDDDDDDDDDDEEFQQRTTTNTASSHTQTQAQTQTQTKARKLQMPGGRDPAATAAIEGGYDSYGRGPQIETGMVGPLP